MARRKTIAKPNRFMLDSVACHVAGVDDGEKKGQMSRKSWRGKRGTWSKRGLLAWSRGRAESQPLGEQLLEEETMTEWEGSRLRKSVVNCPLALRSTSSHRHHFPSSLSLRHHHRPTRHRPRCRRQRQRTALIPPAQSAPFAWTAAAISTDIEPFWLLRAQRPAPCPRSLISLSLGSPRPPSLLLASRRMQLSS